MKTEPINLTNRKREIAMLEAAAAKSWAAITMTELTLQRLREKYIIRLAELRVQKMMLRRAEFLAAQAASSTPEPSTKH